MTVTYSGHFSVHRFRSQICGKIYGNIVDRCTLDGAETVAVTDQWLASRQCASAKPLLSLAQASGLVQQEPWVGWVGSHLGHKNNHKHNRKATNKTSTICIILRYQILLDIQVQVDNTPASPIASLSGHLVHDRTNFSVSLAFLVIPPSQSEDPILMSVKRYLR